jgi:hypothetical protein
MCGFASPRFPAGGLEAGRVADGRLGTRSFALRRLVHRDGRALGARQRGLLLDRSGAFIVMGDDSRLWFLDDDFFLYDDDFALFA